MALVYVVASLQALELINPLPMILVLIIQFVISVFWSYLVNRLYFSMNMPKKAVIIYRDEQDLHEYENIRHFKHRWNIVKKVYCPEPEIYGMPDDTKIIKVEQSDIDNLVTEIKDAEVIFISGINVILRNEVVEYCIDQGKECYFVPHIGDVIVSGAKHVESFSFPLLYTKRYTATPISLFFKRLFDLVSSFLVIILTSPIMLITAIAIKLDDGGPVFYKQVRYTKDSKKFEVIKFRSMKVDSDKFGATSENDNRITKVGHFIRSVRIDELPQLFNIFIGDMSVVGPRPEWVELVDKYNEELPAFNLRHQVKGGLTGYAQIYGRYNTTPEDKLKMDLMYINNISLVADLRIILATIRVVLGKNEDNLAGFEKERVSELQNFEMSETNKEISSNYIGEIE